MKKILITIVALLLVVGATTGIMYTNGKDVVEEGEDMYMVSHSEYWTDETGQIIARLYNWQGEPIAVDNCTVDIYNPDDKTLYVSGALTNDSLQASTGSHFYKFTTPATEGVYQYMVTCAYSGKTRSVASSFHLNPALNLIKDIDTNLTTLIGDELTRYGAIQDNFSALQDNFADIQVNLSGVNTDLGTIITDLTGANENISYIRENMLTDSTFQSNISDVLTNQDTIIAQGNQVLDNLSAIKAFCDDVNTNTSTLCTLLNAIDGKVDGLNTTQAQYTDILNEINATTHSTYDYVTGTLASNIGTLLSGQTAIQNTVNQIDATVDDIEANVSTVITNQEEVVYMDVTS